MRLMRDPTVEDVEISRDGRRLSREIESLEKRDGGMRRVEVNVVKVFALGHEQVDLFKCPKLEYRQTGKVKKGEGEGSGKN